MTEPLPGERLLSNRMFAIEYMRSHGFEVREDAKSEYPNKYLYYLRGELVGWSYDTVMYLQPVMPSLLQMGILPQRGKTEIPFNRPGIEVHDRLRDTVNELKSSSDSYEDTIKQYRVKRMRKYFKRKREDELIEKAWETVPDGKDFKPEEIT